MEELKRLRQENAELRRLLEAALNRIEDDSQTLDKRAAIIGSLQQALISQPVGQA